MLGAFPAATHRAFGVDSTDGAAGARGQLEAAGYKGRAQHGDDVAGRGRWFGAFVGGQMLSGMGLFSDGEGLARFQSVDTHPEARGRGLAGTLVHHASTDGCTELGASTLVMVADPAYLAIRLYRSVGFADTELQVGLERPPPSPPHASAGRSAT